jgi:hypothetical protein
LCFFFTIPAGAGTSVAEDTLAANEHSPNNAIAGEEEGSPWTLYFRPGVRFGTDDRTLFILDFLVPLYQGRRNIVFFNPKFTPNNQEGWEVNLGLGYRHLLIDERLVLGINAFYDTRRTDWGTYHRQWGLGAEVMTELPVADAWDLGLTGRFNYYSPLTSARITGAGGAVGYFFQGNAIFSRGGMVEEPLGGFDAEIGVRIPYISDLVETWFYAGGYHFGESRYVADIDGFVARVELLPADFMRLNYEFRKDRTTRRGDHYGEVCLEFPFSVENLIAGKNPFAGFGSALEGSRTLTERLVEPVRRDVDIVVAQDVTGTGGTTAQVEEVVFVAEDPPDADPLDQDGSFEHPYGSLDDAQSTATTGGVRTIHIMNNSDTETVPRMSTVVTLDDLLLWGSGAPHPTYGWIQNQYAGFPTVICDGGGRPAFAFRISSADNVELTGVEVRGINGGRALYDTDPPSRISLHHNRFDVVAGVYIVQAKGNMSIAYNDFSGDAPYPLYFSADSMNDILIDNNVIDCNAEIGIYFNGSDGTIADVTISNNTIIATETAMHFEANPLSNNTSIAGLVIRGNALSIASTGAAYGIYLDAYHAGAFTGTINADIFNNSGTINGATSNYFLYVQGDDGTVNWGGIGTGAGQNNVTTSTSWSGNHPGPNGPVQNDFGGVLDPP